MNHGRRKKGLSRHWLEHFLICLPAGPFLHLWNMAKTGKHTSIWITFISMSQKIIHRMPRQTQTLSRRHFLLLYLLSIGFSHPFFCGSSKLSMMMMMMMMITTRMTGKRKNKFLICCCCCCCSDEFRCQKSRMGLCRLISKRGREGGGEQRQQQQLLLFVKK